MELCKVRFDGCHYLVQPYKRRFDVSAEEIIATPLEELRNKGYCFEKKELFYNEWARLYFPFTSKGRKPIPEFYKRFYVEMKQTYKALLEEKTKDKLVKEKMVERIFNNEELKLLYSFEDDLQRKKYVDLIYKFVDNAKTNLKSRKRRFKVKALNNDWNYFATFTYDPKKHSEESFVKTLKKKLQNLHTNYGWLYMGCFERSPIKERLHFHGLLYVPKGAMRGNIREEEYYDTKGSKKAVSYINEEFEDKIGRNDFKSITRLDLTFTHALDYIIKYIGKSDNKIVYSKGIKDDVFCLMDYEENIICPVGECSPYYVCSETSKIELTKQLDIDFNQLF